MSNYVDFYTNTQTPCKIIQGGGKMVYKIIRYFSITSNYKGYRLIIDAIEMYATNNDKCLKITKDIYPALAIKYKMSSSSVERNIRTIVETCWKNDRRAVEQLLGYKINKCPSNAVFIDAIAYHIIANNE